MDPSGKVQQRGCEVRTSWEKYELSHDSRSLLFLSNQCSEDMLLRFRITTRGKVRELMHQDRKDSELEEMHFVLKSSEEKVYGSQNTNSALLLQQCTHNIKLL